MAIEPRQPYAQDVRSVKTFGASRDIIITCFAFDFKGLRVSVEAAS